MQLPAQQRHDYCVRKVADTQEVWGLYHAGWATAQADGDIAIPFGDFLHKWLPGMMSNDQLASVFPVPQGSASIAVPADLLRDLQHESEQYE